MFRFYVSIALISLPGILQAQVPGAARVVRAERASAAIRMDGRLDEPEWQKATPVRAFRQVEPRQGAPSWHETDVRVLYDDRNLYLGYTLRDSLGPGGIRVRDLRRDFDGRNNDFAGVIMDPFGDGRTAVALEVTPRGALQDYQVFDGDGSTRNEAWDAPWQARTSIDSTGWYAEFVIPWAMLRYPADPRQWRINFYRRSRRDNEQSAWGDWPRALDASRLEFGGSLEGIAPPAASRANVRMRPYVTTATRTAARGSAAPTDDNVQGGGELIWSPSPNRLLEATVNTDFAQADVDNEVVNLTRFSVFFPERRQFFLEGASLFDVVASEGIQARFGVSEALQVRPFFSRRIGLSDDGNPIAVRGGARFVQQGAGGSLGALVLHQAPGARDGGATFGVLRGSKAVGRKGRFGAMMAARHDLAGDSLGSRTGGVGALDGFVRFNERTIASGLVTFADDNGSGRAGLAASASMVYQSPTLAAALVETVVGRDYQPTTGFVSRTNVFQHQPTLAYDWRPGWKPPWLRRFYWFLKSNIYTDPDLQNVQESSTEAYVDVLFENGALVYPDIFFITQRLPAPFTPVPGVTIPAGTYQFWRPNVYLGTDQSRKLSADIRAYTGDFYDRQLDEVTTSANIIPDPRFGLQLSHGYNRFHGNGPEVTTQLFRGILRTAVNPRVLLTTTYQYNSARGRSSLNARFSWEYKPLSFLFVVLNDATAAGPNASRFTAPGRELLVKLVFLGGR